MFKDDKDQKHIAFVLSLIFPGGGFFYEKKWLTGIIFAAVHFIFLTLLFYHGVLIIYYKAAGISRGYEDILLFVFLIICVFLNWIFNIRKIQNYR